MGTFRKKATIPTQDVASEFHENHVKADEILPILYILLFLFDPEMIEMYAFQNRVSELSPAPNRWRESKSPLKFVFSVFFFYVKRMPDVEVYGEEIFNRHGPIITFSSEPQNTTRANPR